LLQSLDLLLAVDPEHDPAVLAEHGEFLSGIAGGEAERCAGDA